MNADGEPRALKIAADILSHAAWFNNLDPLVKDRLSQPNYDHQQAKRAVELALAVQREVPSLGPGCPAAGCWTMWRAGQACSHQKMLKVAEAES